MVEKVIMDFALADERIRAVLLNGSRANPLVNSDDLQDYDVLLLVEDLESFLIDRSWINKLGSLSLFQLPDEMELGKDPLSSKPSFTFLMMFKEGYRIDLTLFPLDRFNKEEPLDSLTEIWLDKDGIFQDVPTASDVDYHIKKPTSREFQEVANEFYWCSTNVVKGLKRGEILYAKDMLDTVVRPMFWRMIEWRTACAYDFNINLGKSGKFAKRFLSEDEYKRILETYADADIKRNWESLKLMMELFRKYQEEVAKQLGFEFNKLEAVYAMEYFNTHNHK